MTAPALARVTTKAAARMEDALFMLDHGEHPERVAERLGTTVENLVATFRRHHLPVPQPLNAERTRQRIRKSTR